MISRAWVVGAFALVGCHGSFDETAHDPTRVEEIRRSHRSSYSPPGNKEAETAMVVIGGLLFAAGAMLDVGGVTTREDGKRVPLLVGGTIIGFIGLDLMTFGIIGLSKPSSVK